MQDGGSESQAGRKRKMIDVGGSDSVNDQETETEPKETETLAGSISGTVEAELWYCEGEHPPCPNFT